LLSFRDGPSGPDPEPMNTDQALDFSSQCYWIPGSQAKTAPRNDHIPAFFRTPLGKELSPSPRLQQFSMPNRVAIASNCHRRESARASSGGEDARAQEGPARSGGRADVCRTRAGIAARLSQRAASPYDRAAGWRIREGGPRPTPRQKAADQTLLSPTELQNPRFLFLVTSDRE
jgi:hypothetical protein